MFTEFRTNTLPLKLFILDNETSSKKAPTFPALTLIKLNFDYILTAHHANDNLETVLMNLDRGCCIKGLRGILPKNGKVLRPLIEFKKSDFRSSLEMFGNFSEKRWRTDPNRIFFGDLFIEVCRHCGESHRIAGSQRIFRNFKILSRKRR